MDILPDVFLGSHCHHVVVRGLQCCDATSLIEVGIEVARDCLDVFLNTEFEGGRHQRRIDKITPD